MPNTAKPWTLEELDRLPDDGNKYEVVHGELFVTPAPSQAHEIILARLTRVLEPYVAKHGLGLVLHPRAVIRFKGSEVEPDLMVRAEPEDLDGNWEDAPTPILVVEVVSPTTKRRDHVTKREFYQEVEVPTYWIVESDARSVRVVRLDGNDTVATGELVWRPRSEITPLVILLADLFKGLRASEE